MVDPQAAPGKFFAEHIGHARQRGLLVTRSLPHAQRFAVVAEPEFHAAARKGERLQEIVDMGELGALGAHELPPRRHVVEQVAHFHAGARRMLRRTRRLQLAAVHLDAKRRLGTARA